MQAPTARAYKYKGPLALTPSPSNTHHSAHTLATPKTASRRIMTDLENCLTTIIEVFHKYSEKEGDKLKLKKSELKQLLTHELPALTEHVKDQATMDSLMESLDADGDTECDFQEFMTFVTMVTICCHDFFEHHEDE